MFSVQATQIMRFNCCQFVLYVCKATKVGSTAVSCTAYTYAHTFAPHMKAKQANFVSITILHVVDDLSFNWKFSSVHCSLPVVPFTPPFSLLSFYSPLTHSSTPFPLEKSCLIFIIFIACKQSSE